MMLVLVDLDEQEWHGRFFMESYRRRDSLKHDDVDWPSFTENMMNPVTKPTIQLSDCGGPVGLMELLFLAAVSISLIAAFDPAE